ncbi:MAG: hypothetical protein L0322_00595 [Chloroflexi bacterium]|nr:hypothetical protein [Chloroflexota bacterium]
MIAPAIGTKVKDRLSQVDGRWVLLLILLAGLALRLRLAPMRGHVFDVNAFKTWTEAAVTGHPLAIYSNSSANYLPLALVPMVSLGTLYRWFFSPEFDTTSPLLTALFKLPAIAADLVTAAVLYRLVQRRDGSRWALACSALYTFNPAVWYVSAWWGQLEALYALPMLLAVAAVEAVRPGWGWAWLAVGVLVKPHAAAIAPALLVASWQEGKVQAFWRGGVAGGLVTAVVLAPLALAGQLPAMLAQVQRAAGRQLFLTLNAHNLWYLLSLGRGSFAARDGMQRVAPIYDTQPLLGSLTGWQIGLILLAGWCLLVAWLLWRGANLYLAAAALVVGYYMLPAEAHERYLFPALALLVPLLPGHRPARWLYLVFSLGLWLNLLWVDPAVPLPGFSERLAWGIPIAALHVAAFGVMGLQLWDDARPARG